MSEIEKDTVYLTVGPRDYTFAEMLDLFRSFNQIEIVIGIDNTYYFRQYGKVRILNEAEVRFVTNLIKKSYWGSDKEEVYEFIEEENRRMMRFDRQGYSVGADTNKFTMVHLEDLGSTYALRGAHGYYCLPDQVQSVLNVLQGPGLQKESQEINTCPIVIRNEKQGPPKPKYIYLGEWVFTENDKVVKRILKFGQTNNTKERERTHRKRFDKMQTPSLSITFQMYVWDRVNNKSVSELEKHLSQVFSILPKYPGMDEGFIDSSYISDDQMEEMIKKATELIKDFKDK